IRINEFTEEILFNQTRSFVTIVPIKHSHDNDIISFSKEHPVLIIVIWISR
uniref:Uncharacterized protein n=1 Tax=Amphimedon queenslandica TaxID=400682 RepID=A0A1X7UU43_AMPQE